MSGARCRWHDDPGRCGDAVAAPGVPEVPELCPRHLTALEPWIRSRAGQPADADSWIAYMRRRAAESDQLRRVLGIDPPLYRERNRQ